MYYALILLSVVMFGGCFALQDYYRKLRGSGLRISMEAACVGAVAGLVVLLWMNGLCFEFTLFTLVMALIAAVNGIAFTFFTFQALNVINLSLFSLFSMLGGMVLPFVQGILFYDERMTVAKGVCVIFICAALALTVTRGQKKRGYFYYVGVFLLNGMSGVLSKLFNELPFEKTSAVGYSIWIAICTAVLSSIAWLILSRKKQPDEPRYLWRAGVISAVSGGVNRIANFLLVLALLHVDASVQYPMVTGGVMIVSTLICLFGERKPSKRELLSVGLAFLGMLALFIIPI